MPTVTVAALLAGGGVAVALSQTSPPAPAGTPRVSVTTTTAPTATAATAPPTASAAPDNASHHTASGHTTRHATRAPLLVVKVVGGDCYVEVSRGSHVLTRRVAHPGARIVVERGPASVLLGNAGAAVLTVRGHHPHRAGRDGQVRRFDVG